MIDYRVRSISLLNLVNDVRKGLLIPDAYFQRNIVWREVHNKDFIKTILMGFPFPQIFISKGKVDVEKMSTISCIVDGQQRTNAIIKFIENEYDVDGKYYSDLTESEKSNFLKYEIAVIELDLQNDDPKVQEIFQRINRTSNSLTAIEKLASEYATSIYMFVAKILADQVDITQDVNSKKYKEDPGIPQVYFDWARTQKASKFQQLILTKKIFTARDLSKKSHLMHILNMMSTLLTDFFNRNEKTLDFLDDYKNEFQEKDEIIKKLNETASLVLSLKLKLKSYWYNKSNFFSLIVGIGNRIEEVKNIDIDLLKENLLQFEENIPSEYKLSATEGVNNKKEREIRNRFVDEIISNSMK